MSHCSSTAASAALSLLFLTATATKVTSAPCAPLADLLEGFAAKHKEVPVAAGNMTTHSIAILLTSRPADHTEKQHAQTWTLLTAQIPTRGPSAGKVIACIGPAGNEWYPVTPDIPGTDAPIAKASSLFPHDDLVARLRETAHEVLQGFAIDSDGYLIELFVSNDQNNLSARNRGPSAQLQAAPTENTFTIVVTDPYNYSSIFAAGRDWRRVEPLRLPQP